MDQMAMMVKVEKMVFQEEEVVLEVEEVLELEERVVLVVMAVEEEVVFDLE